MTPKRFACSIEFSCTAETPEQAAREFMKQILKQHWGIHVTDAETHDQYTVHSTDFRVSCKKVRKTKDIEEEI